VWPGDTVQHTIPYAEKPDPLARRYMTGTLWKSRTTPNYQIAVLYGSQTANPCFNSYQVAGRLIDTGAVKPIGFS